MIDKEPNSLTLKERIDADKGLKSKRVILTALSLVLLAVTFTGAVIEKANTFIFEINFKHTEELSLLIASAIFFLLIHYYSYARKYHQELTEMWKKDFRADDHINYECGSGECFGLMADIAPDEYKDGHYYANEYKWDASYTSKFLILRYFIFTKHDVQHGIDVECDKVNILTDIGVKGYLIALWTEFKHKLLGFVRYSENLDVKFPYLLGLISLASLVYQEQLQSLLTWVLG